MFFIHFSDFNLLIQKEKISHTEEKKKAEFSQNESFTVLTLCQSHRQEEAFSKHLDPQIYVALQLYC